ncbi:hypothetical protein [Paenibacillus odorifer]|uniref:hypothetical protein n=1 Tax=Paenibacillus odorifer TaxID=189426 RepID=UPI000BA0D27F|nr:hypothetical protein [Paenibacillus odorifer]OZQ77405.1 hypothetical protein CA596_07495 [Paenibacillus odorifer]
MKKNTYKVLLTDNDFLMAALTQSEVSVWYRRDPDPVGQMMDRGGIVEGYTPESIKISGAIFIRHILNL